MNTKNILIQCLCLTYADKLKDGTATNFHLVNEILESDMVVETREDHHAEIIEELARAIVWIKDFNGAPNYKALHQRIRLLAGKEPWIINIFEDGFATELTEQQLSSYIYTLVSEVSEVVNKLALRKLANNFRRQTYKENDPIKLAELAVEVKSALETHGRSSSASPLDAFDIVDTADADTMREALHKGIQQISAEGILQLGQAGLNEMLGTEHGLRPGNQYGIGALSHNGKSLSLKTWPMQVIRNNKPMLLDPEKKPLAIYFSFEDSNEKTIQEQFKYVYEMKHKRPIVVKDLIDSGEIDIEGMMEYITNEVKKNGWNYMFFKGIGANTTYYDIINCVEELKRQGYEVKLVSIDYPDLMSRRFCEGERGEEKTTHLIRNLRQYFESEGIPNVIAHQLSDQALQLARDGEEYLARDAAGKGMWKGCRTLSTEPDVEIVQHIVEIPGQPKMMTYGRGKHRGVSDTPTEKKFVVYEFQEYGGLGEDLDNPRFKHRITRGQGGTMSLDPEWSLE